MNERQRENKQRTKAMNKVEMDTKSKKQNGEKVNKKGKKVERR